MLPTLLNSIYENDKSIADVYIRFALQIWLLSHHMIWCIWVWEHSFKSWYIKKSTHLFTFFTLLHIILRNKAIILMSELSCKIKYSHLLGHFYITSAITYVHIAEKVLVLSKYSVPVKCNRALYTCIIRNQSYFLLLSL